jgi:two-component system sensor histidine kinase KdpD
MLLASIDSQADRLDVLIEELLDMSRVEEGSIELVTDEVDVVDLVELATEEATEGAAVPPSSITLSGLGSLAAVTDPTLVVRILVNLLGNALRYGGAPVEVEVAERGDEAVVRVVDNGPGVPASERDAIFRPFQRRGDVDMTRGVGLGLAIAKGFADALGGGLEVEETPGGGCTMVLTVPTLVGPPRVSGEG